MPHEDLAPTVTVYHSSRPTYSRLDTTHAQAWNTTSQILTQASAPELTSFPFFPSFSVQNTTLTPPEPAFLISMFTVGFSTLQTYTLVSSDPDAQCLPSEVQWIELIFAEWKTQCLWISYRKSNTVSRRFLTLWGNPTFLSLTSNRISFPLDWVGSTSRKVEAIRTTHIT